VLTATFVTLQGQGLATTSAACAHVYQQCLLETTTKNKMIKELLHAQCLKTADIHKIKAHKAILKWVEELHKKTHYINFSLLSDLCHFYATLL
jgi:hypothetical protein